MKPTTLLFAVLAAAASAAQPADLSESMILVAKPELVDQLYGSSVLVVTPVGPDQHVGFIVNRPTNVTLGELFPEDGPSQKVVDPVYLGGPLNSQVIFALVEGKQSPGHKSFELMPGLHAAVDEETVDRIIRTAPRALRRRPRGVAARRAARRDRARRVVRAAARSAPRAAQAERGPVGRAGQRLEAAREQHLTISLQHEKRP
jgi:hypothetical protein